MGAFNQKPIVVFGGSFNPPTNAHLGLTEQIVNDFDIEKVLFLPVGDFYNKKDLLPAKERVGMLEEVCRNHNYFEVSLIEANSPRQLPTIESLEVLQMQYPNNPLWFVVGTDNLRDLPNWDRYEDILSQFYVLVLERGEDKASDIIKENEELNRLKTNIVIMNEEVRTTCSSTIVRNRIKQGKKVEFLIPNPVYQYIRKKRLYH